MQRLVRACLGQLALDADPDLLPHRAGSCAASLSQRPLTGGLSVSVGFGGLAHHLDRAPCALGEQHRAFGNFAVDLWRGLHEPVSTNRMGTAKLLPRKRPIFHALRLPEVGLLLARMVDAASPGVAQRVPRPRR